MLSFRLGLPHKPGSVALSIRDVKGGADDPTKLAYVNHDRGPH